MKKRLLSLLLLAPLFSHAADEARLLRFPATNGRVIVFTYAGDLYSVPASGGMASRLTSSEGYEMFPRFSPDGSTIAFTGQYDGNTEVYTMPWDGGEPLRVTYTATVERDDLGDRMGPNNIVMDWTPDGTQIVYRSKQRTSGFVGLLFTVDKRGGLSTPIPLPEGGFCSYASDGTKLAYNRVFREFRTWKYYQGGMADDIWIYDFKTQKTVNATNNPAQDIIPMWIGDEIFFLSDRDRTMNLFVYNTLTGETGKVTAFTDYDIKFPSCHGTTIVFENGGYIYKFDAKTRRYDKVSIALSSDNSYARSEIKDGSKYITAVDLSAGGERLCVTTRGEVFDVPVKRGVSRNITRSAGANDRGAVWSPDNKHVAYISDATGETEVYVYDTQSAETKQLTKGNDTYILYLEWSPDSKSVLYADRRNRVCVVDVATAKVTTLVEDAYGVPGGVEFSADGKWLTYTRTASNDFSVVYIYDIAAGKEYAVTDKWYKSSNPVFSSDGKYLIFTSARDFNPTYGSTEWNHVYNNMNGLYIALLSNDTPSPFMGTDEQLAFKGQDTEKKKESETSGNKDAKIDPADFSSRIVRIPLGAASYGNFYGKNDKIYYTRNGSSYLYDLKAQKEELVVEGGSLQAHPWSDKALVRKDGKYYVIDLPSGKAGLGETVDLSNMAIATDYSKEWPQIFDEAWRHMRDGFYTDNMHGVDWPAMKAKYAVLLPYVKNRMDLNYVIGEMIGELNCGHAYIAMGEYDRPKRIQTGLLGAEVSRDGSGCFRIEKILPGASWSTALRSPLTEAGLNVKEGDYIIAVDGIPTDGVKDFFSLLVGKADVPTELTVNTKASAAGARKIVIRPIASEDQLYHYNWVQENIRKVDQASGGRIGYIYIPDMGVEGLNEFARYFYPQIDKEGLIIDDRANGGGNVSPMILERLAREAYRATMRRGSARVGTIPDRTQIGPKVCLINKYSASDGDLFPWGFRELGLGKLIGTRTWGGIVGITSSLPFIDGTTLSVPFYTSFSIRTGEWIIENYGVAPDIQVDNDPAREWNGEDQQLDRAVEEVMNQLKDRKPLPPVPAPRDFSK